MAENNNGGPELQKVPPVAWAVSITVIGTTLIICLTFLAYTESDPAELRSLINTVINIATLIFGAGGFIYGSAAARSSRQSAQNTNGTLDARIQAAVDAAMRERGNNDG